MSDLRQTNNPPEQIRALTQGVDGIYSSTIEGESQSLEIRFRNEVASVRHSNPLEHISRHHSIPVMDREIHRFTKTLPHGAQILDIGGCWGWHWRNISKTRPDLRIFILDIVRANLLHAHDLLKDQLGKTIFLVHGDAANLAFPEKSFDAVWSVQAFQHIPPFTTAIKEAHRVLRPGGSFANYSLNVQPHIQTLYFILRKKYVKSDWLQGSFWLARASQTQRNQIREIFTQPVRQRWTEFLFSPELRFTRPGRHKSFLGWIDKYLSNNFGFLGWFARQRSFHTRKGYASQA